ncbi:MAG: hypothetical protein M0Z66_07300 [Thermaerobacter sp.]|nr:hypothetical protein [Thermaerobacter sp.]
MRRDEMEHIVRAAGTILNEDHIIVVGSQAILGVYPEDLPEEATISRELDLLPFDDPYERKADLITGTLGEGSPFHHTFHVYADGVSKSTSRLPRGWEKRLVPVLTPATRGVTAYCLEPHDLLIAKYLANREKDRRFCRAIIKAGLAKQDTLQSRLAETDCEPQERELVQAAIHMDFMVREAPNESAER